MVITNSFLLCLVAITIVLGILFFITLIILTDKENPSHNAGCVMAVITILVYVCGSFIMYHFGQDDGIQAYMNNELVADTISINPKNNKVIEIDVHNTPCFKLKQ